MRFVTFVSLYAYITVSLSCTRSGRALWACVLYEIVLQYTHVQPSLRVMYDDYDLDYTLSNDYNLDEDSYYENTRDLHEDDDYARDGQDYESLAYRHYA